MSDSSRRESSDGFSGSGGGNSGGAADRRVGGAVAFGSSTSVIVRSPAGGCVPGGAASIGSSGTVADAVASEVVSYERIRRNTATAKTIVSAAKKTGRNPKRGRAIPVS